MLSSLVVSTLYLVMFLYLVYLILLHIHATDVMWFVYTIMVPIGLVGTGLAKLFDWENKKKNG